MELTSLVAQIADAEILAPQGVEDVVIFDVVHDSRSNSPGSLFCCIVGARSDGHDHVDDAIANGAVAVLAQRPLDIDVPVIVVPDTRIAMAEAAAAVARHPAESMTVIGVTGTNGKTTTTAMLDNIFAAAGRRVEVLGTLSGARTTPESTDLQRQLASWRDDGVDVVAMEVSSHAIELHRVDAMRFDVAIFTNLSRDHLDWHGSMEEYFAVKARLFGPDHCERAVVNLDSPYGRLLSDAATVPTDGYSLDEIDQLELSVEGSTFRWRDRTVTLGIAGEFNVSNALAAAHCASVLGVDDGTIAAGLSTPLVVEGRFERVEAGQPFAVIVDYAHTPDGLEQLLLASDPLVSADDAGREGRVIVVFGCGGDRDATKRPLMGAVAARNADLVVITADNSRSEDTSFIIDSIVQGYETAENRRSSDLVIEPDRRRAIGVALSEGRSGDIVLIAGKGHETTQIIGTETTTFDDRIVAREEWARLEMAS